MRIAASGSRDAVRFGILLTILFAIAAVAVRVILSIIIEDLPGADTNVTAILVFAILSVTFAFMCIAGAVGVWALRHTAAREGRLRVGRFVSELDALPDGLLIADRHGNVLGGNPALGKWTARPLLLPVPLAALFPCLTADDVAALLKAREPCEIERTPAGPGTPETLRFRAQPAEDMHVIFVSDITSRRAEEIRREQIARFQLVGRIARGVAYDFNNILCGIAGHAVLLPRLPRDSRDRDASIAAIARESERGIALSRHLLDLSHTGMAGTFTRRLDHFTQRSAELLRIGLSSAWTVVCETDSDFPPAALSGIQIEQIILNLGLLATDSLPRPGNVRVSIHKPAAAHLLDVDERFAAVLLVSASCDGAEPLGPSADPPARESRDSEGGIILSVVRAMIEETGGRLDILHPGANRMLYRALLPRSLDPTPLAAEPESDFTEYLAGLKLLLAGQPELVRRLHAQLNAPDSTGSVAEAGDAVSLLAEAERLPDLDVILIDQRLLGAETDAFLRALLKLRPQTGILLLTDADTTPPPQTRGIVVLPARATPADLARGVLEAKGLARRVR